MTYQMREQTEEPIDYPRVVLSQIDWRPVAPAPATGVAACSAEIWFYREEDLISRAQAYSSERPELYVLRGLLSSSAVAVLRDAFFPSARGRRPPAVHLSKRNGQIFAEVADQ